VQFDDQYEVVHAHVPVQDVPPLTDQTYVPRGSTALLDAIGRTIVATGARLAMMAEADRPHVLIFAVQTDGFENASREFSRQQIFDMIRHQEAKYAWHFVCLAADQDAIAEGGRMGFASASALDYDKDGDGVTALYSAMTLKIGEVRRGEASKVEFSPTDRARTKRR